MSIWTATDEGLDSRALTAQHAAVALFAVGLLRQLETLNRQIAGRRLWLVPDNYGRPISIESAIMKGGSSTTGIWLEPDSAMIRQAVPDLEFRFERNDSRPVDVQDYAAIFFMAKGDLEERQRALNERYRIDLFKLECGGLLQMETGTLVRCQH